MDTIKLNVAQSKWFCSAGHSMSPSRAVGVRMKQSGVAASPNSPFILQINWKRQESSMGSYWRNIWINRCMSKSHVCLRLVIPVGYSNSQNHQLMFLNFTTAYFPRGRLMMTDCIHKVNQLRGMQTVDRWLIPQCFPSVTPSGEVILPAPSHLVVIHQIEVALSSP